MTTLILKGNLKIDFENKETMMPFDFCLQCSGEGTINGRICPRCQGEGFEKTPMGGWPEAFEEVPVILNHQKETKKGYFLMILPYPFRLCIDPWLQEVEDSLPRVRLTWEENKTGMIIVRSSSNSPKVAEVLKKCSSYYIKMINSGEILLKTKTRSP